MKRVRKTRKMKEAEAKNDDSARSEAEQLQPVVMCKDCKYWDNSKTYNAIPVALESRYGRCGCDAFAYEDVEDYRTDMLIYSDYDGYSAGFDTGADFGCVHGVKRT